MLLQQAEEERAERLRRRAARKTPPKTRAERWNAWVDRLKRRLARAQARNFYRMERSLQQQTRKRHAPNAGARKELGTLRILIDDLVKVARGEDISGVEKRLAAAEAALARKGKPRRRRRRGNGPRGGWRSNHGKLRC